MSVLLSPAQVEQAKKLIGDANHIVITSHKSPDGDAIGSALALYLFLKKKGKNVSAILPDEVPDFLQWLPGYSDIILFDKHTDLAKEIIQGSDLIFSLDYNHLGRVGEGMSLALESASANFILIDHHQSPGDFPTVTYSDTSSCSTGEMIYRFLDFCGWKNEIDAQIATCIYCGIMTDSGSFRFPAVTSSTHRIVADLIDLGLDHANVHRQVYDTNLLDRMKLIGYALSQKLEIIEDAATAIISLTSEELQRFNHRQGDTEGLVNQALSIRGVKLAVFFREGNNEIKASFRSKGSFDVNNFSRKYWGGGGHMNAAGGSSKEDMSATLNKLRQLVNEHKTEIQNS